MEKLAAFVMIGLLYLASTLAEVESIKYSGDTLVRDGQAWNITCSEVPASAAIMWKRNGQPLVEDLASGIMHVEPPKVADGYISSVLIATTALERHEGGYVCAEGNETHHLAIVYDVTLKVLTKNDSAVVLDCPQGMSGEKAEWTKDKMPVILSELITGGNTSLTIKYHADLGKADIGKAKEIFGNYTCKVGNSSADYRVVRKPEVSMSESTNVVEGEKLHLTCNVRVGDPGLKILWTYKGVNYTTSNGRVKLQKDNEHGFSNAVFSLENIEMDDRGDINCTAYYNIADYDLLHSDVANTYVRVKDKLAALWPFLGICAEVVVLCLIILIYEKKRNKSELEESDTDQSPDTKPTPNKDSDVRQRK